MSGADRAGSRDVAQAGVSIAQTPTSAAVPPAAGAIPSSPPPPARPTSSSSSALKRPWMSTFRRPRTSPGPRASPFTVKSRSHLANDDPRRDSGMTSATMHTNASVERERPPSESTAATAGMGTMEKVPSVPAIVVSDGTTGPSRPVTAASRDRNGPSSPRQDVRSAREARPSSSAAAVQEQDEERDGSFRGITTAIPTGSLDDLFAIDSMQFSKRGSVLLGGKRMNGTLATSPSFWSLNQASEAQQAAAESSTEASRRLRASRQLLTASKILSVDEDMLSKRVRSMYEHGDENAADWALPSNLAPGPIMEEDALVEDDAEESTTGASPAGSPALNSQLHVSKARIPKGAAVVSPSLSSRRESIVKQPNEAAGGIEDWQDVDPGDVNRYGFIVPKKVPSRAPSSHSMQPDGPGVQRMSTSLQVASESPRRRRIVRRTQPAARSASATPSGEVGAGGSPQLRRKGSKRSLQHPASVYSNRSASTTRTTQTMSPLRYASNRLPYNRERRWMDEASDMLTAPPGLADIEEAADDGRTALAAKKKEWEREEKWRKMGKVSRKDAARGGGMVFDFDTRDAKLIERTWKGIPDRWRATAWYAFLAASARRRAAAGLPGGESDELLKETFAEAQARGSADDVQIDVDVPRTINSHIMFRRRYRGGQRLLFRVLHALSLYLQVLNPDMGYVQGMAALVATLLCYYDEEDAFVMMVRLWQLRGLDHFYRAGFGGLMEVLDDFETNWLAPSSPDVAARLQEFGIAATSYGTRWYLTLFNYSIPFPAQLRVWDVFMLLGDAPLSTVRAAYQGSSAGGNSEQQQQGEKSGPIASPTGLTADLDVLHATSAALVDATREIILDSDFENAMKVLTSWIPVKDEDILMRVARAEYRQRRKKSGKQV